jgi:hypothetical protein
MIHDDDQGLVVPRRPVGLELTLFGRAPERATVFVSATEGGAYERHAVLDLLEQEARFLPTQTESDRTPQLINKDTLVWAAIASDKAVATGADDGDDALFEYRHEVRVELVGGDMLVGELLYTLPPAHARVVDYLNGPGRFFRLRTLDRLFLIHKNFVERVIEAPLDLEE